jgi:hypothetical protein
MRRPALVLLGFLTLFAVTATKAQTPGAGSKPATGAPSSSAAAKPIHLPLFFEANQGQADSRVQFMARGKGYTLLLTPTETVLEESQTQVSARSGTFGPFQNPAIATKTSRGNVIRMQLVGANSAPAMTGLEELPGKVNYLIGNDPSKWQTQVPLYSQAQAEEVYPGVNLLFHGDERQLEYDFVVAPGADPSKIAFRIRGAARMKINTRGDLVLRGMDSDFVMHKPVIYQTIASERRPIEGSFVKKGKNEVAFRLGAYDHGQALVIDPAIGFSSFLGGGSDDISGGLVIDDSTPGSPKLYLGGFTGDSTTFPEKNGVTIIGSGTSTTVHEVGFVAKVDPTITGSASLVYLTFIGGSVPNLSTKPGCLSGFIWLALDKSQGAANIEPVLGGITNCSDFPGPTGTATVLHAVSGTGTGNGNTPIGAAAVVARIKPGGAAIDQAAILGGNNDLGGGFVAIGTSGNVILSGDSQATDLPSKNAYVSQFNNGTVTTPPLFDDCFVTVLNRADLSINYLTYLNVGGGTNTTNGGVGCGAFEDSSGNILAGGNTLSPTAFNLGSGGSSLANGFQTTFQGTKDTFAMKLNTNLVGVNQLLYATYFGGGGDTRAGNGSLDLGNGVVAIVGGTTSNSANGDIPLKNAFQTKNNATGNGMVGFLVLINTMQTGLASLQCGTYFGGSGGDEIVGAVTYDAGDPTNYRIILGGRTNSATDFPTLNPIQPYVGAVVSGVQSPDGFLSVLRVPTPNQTAFNASLVFSTYIGGSNPPASVSGQSGPMLLEDDRISAVAVDANHTIYAVGDTNAPGGFFANTNPTTTVNGFQTTCTSCNDQSPLFPIDDVVVFSIATGGNATLQSIAVTPTATSIAVGQTQQFSAVGNFNDGTEKDITSLVTWTTVPTGFATMSTTSPGLAMGTAAGSTAVTPSLGTATVLNTGALTVTAGAGADLAITITAPSNIALGADLPYVITVTNNGPQDATGVVMTDPVPGNLNPLMVVASETCTRLVNLGTGQTTLSCAIGALANGASTQISYHVTPIVAGSLTNTATVAGSSTDPNMNNNSASVTTTIGAGAATHFSVTAPGTATAGTPFSVTVTALDASNAVVTGYTGTVHFTSSDTQAVLPPNSTLTNGVGTFSVTLKTAGAQTIAATDTVTATITGASGTITVTAAAPITLQVKTAGTAFGTVTDNLGQINCTQIGGANPSGTCTTQYPSGTQVTLTATTPGTGAFVGAPTACTGTGNTCQFTIAAAETVTATFTPGPGMFPLTVAAGTPHTGGGTITSAPTGINCTLTGATTSGTCTQNFPAGTLVTLTSAPGPGSNFFGWTGTTPNCLASSSVSCLLNMSAATTAMVQFTSGGGTVNVTVTGAGNVTDTANAGEINCTNTAGGTQTGTCSGGYTLGAGVTLTETPAAGATFSGWTGASCTNPTAATCSFQVINTTPIAVGATFTSGTGATLVSIAVSPNPDLVQVGTTSQLTATGTFSDMTQRDLTNTATWTSSDATIATVSTTGLATAAKAGGPVTIMATQAGVVGSTSLIVTPIFTGPYQLGQLFASFGNGFVGVFKSDGTFLGTINTGQVSSTGMAFDVTGNLYVTTFSTPTGVVKIDTNGKLVGPFGSGYTGNPESIVFTHAGDAIVGAAQGPPPINPAPIFEFDAKGNPIATFQVVPDQRGTDWVELLQDQKTLLYTSEGTSVKSFNTSTNAQNPDFGSGLASNALFALRQLPDGSVLVADTSVALRLSAANGSVIQTYKPTTPPQVLFALNLDPDGTSFWTADAVTGVIYRFDIASGNQLTSFTAPSQFVSGLAIFGEKAPGQNNITVTENGSGSGTVTSQPAGINCPTVCVAPFTDNTAIVLTASPAQGSSFGGFGSNCTPSSPQTNPPSCTVSLATTDVTVSVTFSTSTGGNLLTVATAGTGSGTVTGAGINCTTGSANGCMASPPAGTQVVLTQAVTNGSTFAGWNGAPTSCTVAGATCTFTMPASAETVTATFTAAAATLKSIAVTPANATEPINSSVQFTATGTFSDNSTKDITATVNWASSNPEAATINATGLVTVGGTAGLTTTISAALNEVTGSTLLTVSSSPISISVTPPAGGAFPPVPPGGTLAIGIVLTSTPGFSGTVTFGCTTSSPTITCAPDPATVTLTPTGPTDVAIVLNTFCKGATTTGSVPIPGGLGGGFTLLLLSLTLGGVLWMWRRSPRWAVSFAILVLMAIGGASCASPPRGPNGATQPGNYTVTFSATVNGVTTSTAPIPFTVE